MKKKLWIIIPLAALLLGAIFYFIIRQPAEKKRVVPVPKAKPVKIAIVLDDWGYNMNNIKLLNSIDIPLNISILPNLPFSMQIADKMHRYKNREVILHLPMEPEDKSVRLEKTTLLVSMKDEEVLKSLASALEAVPYAKGVSNHMGSKATQDKRVVGVVMEELKRRKLYFLDSFSTPKSVCKKTAKDLNIKFARRSIFLDNAADKNYISSQMDRLIKLARRNGCAIGIGHDRKLTLEVIKDKAESLKDSDIEFVFVSRLAKSYGKK